jgi:hypothetical protein
MAKRKDLKTDFTSPVEFIQLYNDAITSPEEADAFTYFHEDILQGNSPSEETVKWIKTFLMSLVTHYKSTAMDGIPLMESNEKYQLELDLGDMEPNQLYLHNNENQIHHLVHVLCLLSDEDVMMEFPAQNISLKLNRYCVIVHPGNFSFRYRLVSDVKNVSFVRGALAFQA